MAFQPEFNNDWTLADDWGRWDFLFVASEGQWEPVQWMPVFEVQCKLAKYPFDAVLTPCA